MADKSPEKPKLIPETFKKAKETSISFQSSMSGLLDDIFEKGEIISEKPKRVKKLEQGGYKFISPDITGTSIIAVRENEALKFSFKEDKFMLESKKNFNENTDIEDWSSSDLIFIYYLNEDEAEGNAKEYIKKANSIIPIMKGIKRISEGHRKKEELSDDINIGLA